SAADDVDSGTESEASVDSLDDAGERSDTGPGSASPQDADERLSQDADERETTVRSQSGANDRSSDDSPSRLALNTPDDAGVEWSEDGGGADGSWLASETAGAEPSDSLGDDDRTREGVEVDEDARDAQRDDRDAQRDAADGEQDASGGQHDASDGQQDDRRRFAGLRYARAAAGWLRSLLARLA
ncbi:MAG TPA: hypothetical protein VKM69_01120, partial [Natronoarchaeum rubrum]|nr:hypothetical protein [Natronoarchaeum rubrum]